MAFDYLTSAKLINGVSLTVIATFPCKMTVHVTYRQFMTYLEKHNILTHLSHAFKACMTVSLI